MRKITKLLDKRLAEAIKSDELIAAKLNAGASFVSNTERALDDYCDALIAEVNRFREHLQGELTQLKPIFTKAAKELLGEEETKAITYAPEDGKENDKEEDGEKE